MQDVATMTKPMVISEIGTIRVRLDRMAEEADHGPRGTFKGREAEVYKNLTVRLAELEEAAGNSRRELDNRKWLEEQRKRQYSDSMAVKKERMKKYHG